MGAVGLVGGFEDWDGCVGVRIAAHEEVKGGVADFRPGMARDVAFGEDGDTGHALGLEAVNVEVEERGACGASRVAERLFEHCGVIEVRGLPQIDDEVGAGIGFAVFLEEVVCHGGQMA